MEGIIPNSTFLGSAQRNLPSADRQSVRQTNRQTDRQTDLALKNVFSGGLGFSFSFGFGFAAASERKIKSIFAKITTKTWHQGLRDFRDCEN